MDVFPTRVIFEKNDSKSPTLTGCLKMNSFTATVAKRPRTRLAGNTAPRWLLGRTWGDVSTSLKLESRFDPALIQALKDAGHQVELLPEAYSDTMGHAGALVRHSDGLIEGAADPRSDGLVAGV